MHYQVYKDRNYIIITRIRILWVYFLFTWNHRKICSYTTVAPSKTTDQIPDQNMGKVYTRFQTKMAQKPYSLGRHIPNGLYKGVPPGNIATNGKQGKSSKASAAAHPCPGGTPLPWGHTPALGAHPSPGGTPLPWGHTSALGAHPSPGGTPQPWGHTPALGVHPCPGGTPLPWGHTPA